MSLDNSKYIHEVRTSHDLYKMWIEDIELIDRLLTVAPGEDNSDAVALSRRVAILLFPIIESVSINIFGGSLRKYLTELGYSSKEADLIARMFRNGFIHYNRAIRLEFDDGTIKADWHSVSGSDGLLQPTSRKSFTYYRSDPDNRACLELHWFASQIKFDLEGRLKNEVPRSINYVIGQKIKGSIPEAEELPQVDW